MTPILPSITGKRLQHSGAIAYLTVTLGALMSAVVLSACQPPDSVATQAESDAVTPADTPVVVGDDSVIMSSDYILSIKQSRYQPSLGLQGIIEPLKQSRFVSAQPLTVEKVLVEEGQWVEKGTPLLIIIKQDTKQVTKQQPLAIKANNSVNNNSALDKKIASESNELSPANNNQTVIDSTEIKDAQAKEAQIKNAPISDSNNTDLDKIKSDPTLPDLIAEGQEDEGNPSLPSGEVTDNLTAKKDLSTKKESVPPAQFTLQASFSGRIDKLPVVNDQKLAADKLLLRISDDRGLHFVATLPMQAEPQLSVGQTVSFSAKDYDGQFSGQVSKLVPSSNSDQLLVYVQVINNNNGRNKLPLDTQVSGRVNYGQIEVGAIVPGYGIHDVDLSVLKRPPYKPIAPLTGNIWIIQQDQRLTRQPVEVIEYDPDTKQYLVAGITNDSLICLADLPVESAGKQVIVSN